MDQNAAASAGATLVQILAVNVPTVTGESSEQEINYAKYKKNLSETLEDCKSNKISLYRLTYKKSDTELKLNFTSLLKGKAKFYSVNPWNLHNLVTIDAGIYEEVGGAYFIETSYPGTPQVKMNHTDETAAEELSVTPLVIRFLDQNFKPLVAIECVLAE